jgi:hypothetical protein
MTHNRRQLFHDRPPIAWHEYWLLAQDRTVLASPR